LKKRRQTRRRLRYRALAEGYALLNSPTAGTFHRAADHYDNNDPPLDLAPNVDKVTESESGDTRSD